VEQLFNIKIMKIKGKIVDIINKEIFNGELEIENSKIKSISRVEEECNNFILPGFIDAHIHTESSMLVPSEFAKIAVTHGTVATVSDPHEIANVLGISGIDFMIKDGKRVDFKFFFGVPSCVPATSFETSGANINSNDIENLFNTKELYFLSEMMNFPGVIYNDKEVSTKLEIAKKLNKRIDGHAPFLTGENLKKYANGGITTDHESSTLQEAIDKINLGIKLQIREGSAAKNFDALYKAIELYPDDVMLCSDDLHPDNLLNGHINLLVKRALNLGIDIFTILKVAILNPIKHYNLNVGLLQKDDFADFIVVDNLNNLNIKQTYINGKLVFDNGKVLINSEKSEEINNFVCNKISENDIKLFPETTKINVISAFDGDLTTKKNIFEAKIINQNVVSNLENDVLKLVVVNRYVENSKPAIGFIQNFNLKKGAIASSIAHDSHNIIAIGTSDFEITKVINKLIENKGGIVVSNETEIYDLKLNIAGLMSNESCEIVAHKYETLNKIAKTLGTTFDSPFMTLAFMSLLVIPEIKLGDKGLFDVTTFQPISVFV